MDIVDYRLRLNNCSFSKKKKNIVILVRRSVGELDWIMPLLYSLREKYNVFTIFRSSEIINLIKKDKTLFSLWNKTSFGYTIEPKLNAIAFRIGYFLFKRTILGNYFKYKFQNIFYNISKIEKLIQNQTKTDCRFMPEAIFAEFVNFSPWINFFYNQNKSIKIIYFPHTTNLLSIKKNKIKFKKKIKNRFLLLSNSYDVKHFHKKFLDSNIIEAGYLKYDKSWIKKLLIKKIKKSKKIIYISHQGFVASRMYFKKYTEQTKIIMDICSKIPEIKIIIKNHPMTPKKELLKILNMYPKKKWKLVDDNQTYLAQICDVYISMWDSASILDGLSAKKTPIELWSILKHKNVMIKKSKYQKLNLTLFVKNKIELKNQIIKLLKKDKLDKQQLEIRKRFNKNFFTDGSIAYTKKIIGL